MMGRIGPPAKAVLYHFNLPAAGTRNPFYLEANPYYCAVAASGVQERRLHRLFFRSTKGLPDTLVR